MLNELPGDRPIDVSCILGDQQGCDFAFEIYEFLKTNGFHAGDGVMASIYEIDPPHGLVWHADGNRLKLIVGANK